MTMNTTERLGKDGLSSFPPAVLVSLMRSSRVNGTTSDISPLPQARPLTRPQVSA